MFVILHCCHLVKKSDRSIYAKAAILGNSLSSLFNWSSEVPLLGGRSRVSRYSKTKRGQAISSL